MSDKLAKRQAVAEALEKAAAKKGVTVAELVAGMLTREGKTSVERRSPGGRLPTGLDGADDWAEEERQIGGVLSPGGMRAGGIFGDVPIATSFHDPVAVQQELKAADAAETRRLIQRLHRRLDVADDNDQIEEALAGLLGEGDDDE